MARPVVERLDGAPVWPGCFLPAGRATCRSDPGAAAAAAGRWSAGAPDADVWMARRPAL